MKHPVTTTLTPIELENLKKVKGSESMLKFAHDAIVEKCERCLNDRKNESGFDAGKANRNGKEIRDGFE